MTAALRQAWLDNATIALRIHFIASEAPPIPETVRVSWGFPSRGALRGKKQRIGECWDATATRDAHNEIFVHPTLADHAEPGLQILAVLAHELCHAAVGCTAGHKGPFRRAALSIGLEGKMTSTTPGEAFKQSATPILAALGPFPTSGLDPSKDATRKKQSTRLIKCECEACHMVVRVAKKWLNEVGTPHCPNHGAMVCADLEDDAEE